MKKHLDNSGNPMESVSPTREFPCRRFFFSGQGADVSHDFRRHFENISQLNNWTCEYSRRTLLCCLRGQAEAFAYGLPSCEQNDLNLLLAKLEKRFGPANMKDSFIADARVRGNEMMRHIVNLVRLLKTYVGKSIPITWTL